MNGCRKAKVIITRNIEYNSKIKVFWQEILALLKSVHVKNVIEKKLPDLITRGWVKNTRTQTYPPSPLSKRKDVYISYFVHYIWIVFVVH